MTLLRHSTTSLHIVDGNNYMNRAYHAVPSLTTTRGTHVNAIKGFVSMIEKIQRDYRPTHLVIVFDGKNSKRSRLKIFPAYKSNRERDPVKEKEFFPQFRILHKVLDAARVAHFSIEGCEADDVIGTLVRHNHKDIGTTYIHSSDKDFGQLLINKRIVQCRPESQFKKAVVVTNITCKQTYGVKPKQIINYLQMVSDKIDAVPGVRGIGPKTAQKLLDKYTTLDNILDNVDELPKGQQKCFNNCDIDLSMTYKLIKLDLHIKEVRDLDKKVFETRTPNVKRLIALRNKLEFNQLFGY